MELIDTIDSMISKDYKERFKAEYQQIKIRYYKLCKMLQDNQNNKLSFELKCPLKLLEEQCNTMYRYLSLLEQRAIVENISLNGIEK